MHLDVSMRAEEGIDLLGLVRREATGHWLSYELSAALAELLT